jgi:hypothetical protein
MTKHTSFETFARANGITRTAAYADIIDGLIEYYSTLRPHASMEQVEEWADKHADSWAR